MHFQKDFVFSRVCLDQTFKKILFKVTRNSKHDDDQNIQVINHNTFCSVREFPCLKYLYNAFLLHISHDNKTHYYYIKFA